MKCLTAKVVSLTTLFMIFGFNTFATNYYVSNNGDDNANGKSPATSWKTIQHVNSQEFLPGDSILFKCGDRWMETLVPPSSGNTSHYITFASYGEGANPKLYGSIAQTSFSSHTTLNNVYKCSIETQVNPNDYDSRSYVGSIFFDMGDTIEWGDGLTMYESQLSGLNENFEWAFQGGYVYFYYDQNINNIKAIECTQLERGINIREQYITIDGLDLRYFGSRCIGAGIYPERTIDGVQIRNCHLAYTASKEEGVGFGIALFHSNMIIENNSIHGNGRRNISLNITNASASCILRDVIVQGNELFDGYHTTGVDIGIRGVNNHVKNLVIRNNKIWDYYNVDKGYRSNLIFMLNHGVTENTDSIFIYNNVIKNFTGSAIYFTNVNNLYITNNSFVGPALPKGTFFYNAGDEQGTTYITNNIFMNLWGTQVTFIKAANNGSLNLGTLDNNLHFNENPDSYIFSGGGVDGKVLRFSQFDVVKTMGYEVNSPVLNSYPQFVDSIYNLHLTKYSPAIGAATPVSYVTTDKDGNPRDTQHPDIGAYEFTGSITSSNSPKIIDDDFQVYPNPASNYLSVVVSGKYKHNCTIQLFNMQGIKVYENRNLEKDISKINIADFSKGTYLVKLLSVNKVVLEKKFIFI